MLGYWRMPEATEAAFAGGHLHTGDLALWDDDGFIHIVGRLKEMIKTGGENVFPAEVEQTLLTHAGIAECAVVGVPDPDWGESVLAVIVPRARAPTSPRARSSSSCASVSPATRSRATCGSSTELPRTASTRQVQKAQLVDRFVQGW